MASESIPELPLKYAATNLQAAMTRVACDCRENALRCLAHTMHSVSLWLKERNGVKDVPSPQTLAQDEKEKWWAITDRLYSIDA
jgi:hypothetical protein